MNLTCKIPIYESERKPPFNTIAVRVSMSKKKSLDKKVLTIIEQNTNVHEGIFVKKNKARKNSIMSRPDS